MAGGRELKGYTPGDTTSYTPSRDASWTEDFNEMMFEEHERRGTTRNKFTTQLLEEAIRNRKMKGSQDYGLDQSQFSEEELALLKTEAGQKMISNLVQAALRGHIRTNGDSESVVIPERDIQPSEEPKKAYDASVSAGEFQPSHKEDQSLQEAASTKEVENESKPEPETIEEVQEQGNSNEKVEDNSQVASRLSRYAFKG